MRTTANEKLIALYPAHLAIIKSRFDEALAVAGYDSVVIGAGPEIIRFLDDQSYPFKPNPHILQWLPLLQHPESALLYQPGERPELLIHQPDDFWHAPPELPGAPWEEFFDLTTLSQLEDIDTAQKRLQGQVAYIGDPMQWRHNPPVTDQNPNSLLTYLHFYRPLRTDYEIECIRIANAKAVPAHRAAEQAFRDGASEHEILLSFLAACRSTENDLPYPAIVAKNSHGAVLHYQHYDCDPGHHNSLLIDAGCNCNGYASDITRTYGNTLNESEGSGEFIDLIAGMDKLQRRLVTQVIPGTPFVDLHAAAHVAIGALLQQSGIVSTTIADPVDAGITAAFFPHGLGHFLGLQVHEVGSSFADPAGTEIERPEHYPNLRLIRTLEAGQVLTIEPGLYFIDSLLNNLKNKPAGRVIDWEKINHLKNYGGIRIEDNILVTADGHENLTHQAFESY
ncbi:MAG: Xaa-Pro dipeptidase [Gammaproteobacteria bacterium]|nr:MAG: Xaa-Pro dipeptidase [Gammaproteobacteria bacterium]